MKQLHGKIAIVTGASAGIGYATAKLFAQEGARVVVGARRGHRLIELVQEIEQAGGQASAIAGDVRDESYAEALVEKAEGEYGGLHIAFNNAGTLGTTGDTETISSNAWHETINTNLTSAFFGAKYQLKAMRKSGGGSIIFTSSFVGHSNAGMPGLAAYAASKAGMIGLTQALANEYGSKAIRVNALLPGGTKTDMAPDAEDIRDYIAGKHALRRLADPEEIAKAALYLASDASSFTTGHALLADGGVSINWD